MRLVARPHGGIASRRPTGLCASPAVSPACASRKRPALTTLNKKAMGTATCARCRFGSTVRFTFRHLQLDFCLHAFSTPILHPFDRPRFTTASDLPDSSLVGPSIVRSAPVDPSRYLRDPLGEHRNFRWARGLAHAFTENGTHCVTALNVPWVPQLVVGAVNISLRSDGRFGVEDPHNWPQLYSPLRPHLPFIPKCPNYQAVCASLWLTPTPHDFLRANDDPSGEAYGYLSSRKLRDLRLIVEDLDGMVAIFQRLSPALQTHIIDELLRLHAATRNALALFAVPSSFRNIVSLCGRLHRCWVECWALMRWYHATQRLPPSSHVRANVPLEQGIEGCGVMGAFCTDQSVAQQLYAAGVPV